MKTIDKAISMTVGALIAAPAVLAASVVEIEIDPSLPPVKDLTMLKAGAGMGFNGFLGEGVHANADWYYNTHREDTARAFAESGTELVRITDAVVHHQGERAERVMFATRWARHAWGRAALDMKRWRSWTAQENMFGFFKEHRMKVMLCLNGSVYDPDADAMTDDDGKVERATLDFLRWIQDRGYAETVVGAELENEPYYGRKPADYARRWNRIIPKIRALWPDLSIGLPIAIYAENDPDIAAVRRRGELTDALDGPTHTAAHINQWTGNAIKAMSREALSGISHVQIHTYGANGSYTANHGGIRKARRMLKIYPELAGRNFWITEWRDRSDEDIVCHRQFSRTLWKAQYLQMAVAQRDVDATFLHANGTCAGNLYQSNGRFWVMQRDIFGGTKLPDTTGDGNWRLDVGTAGPLFRLFNDALRRNPLILAHGDEKNYGFDANTRMYDADVMRYFAERDGKSIPPRDTDLTWLIARNKGPERPSVALLLVNTHEDRREVRLSAKECTLGAAWFHLITCEKNLVNEAEMPGERKPWKVTAYQKRAVGRITLPEQSIAVIEIGVKNLKH